MDIQTLKEQGYFPRRYLLAIMGFLGLLCSYMLRINMNLAIVAMSVLKPDNDSQGSSEAEEVCGYTNDGDDRGDEKGIFEWDELTQSLITGSFYWGYCWTQIPGGRMSELFGPKRVLGGSLVLASIFTIFIPITARDNPIYLIINRFLIGLSTGATYPSTHALLSAWAPPKERSVLSAIIYAGAQAGTVVGYILVSVLFTSLGWEYVFYVQGAITLVWCALWFFLVADSPRVHKGISPAEKEYILKSIGDDKKPKSPPVPLKAILTSMPVCAILIAGMSNSWGFYTILTDMPLYMNNMLLKNIKENAMLSALPYLSMLIFNLITSKVGDTLIQKNRMSTGAVRKAATAISQVGPALCLLGVTFAKCDRRTTIALFFIAVTLQGSMHTGFLINHIDISANFAGTLFGLTNSPNTIAGWVGPLVVGALTNGKQTFEQWNKVYYIAAAIYAAGTTFYLIFGSGEVQPWNNPETEEERSGRGNRTSKEISHREDRQTVRRMKELDNKAYDASL